MIKIYREQAGVISEKAVWVCIYDGYMVINDDLSDLFNYLANNWKNEQDLIG